MELPFKIPKTRFSRQTQRGGGRFAVVHWDRETIDFQVCAHKSRRLPDNCYGVIDWTQHEHPLSALAEYFRSESIQVQRLVVLLTRPMLDVLTLNLPAADDAEIPILVANEVEQQLGDAERPPVIDYYSLPPSAAVPTFGNVDSETTEGDATGEAHTGVSVLAFAMTAVELEKLTNSASANGFRLAAVCPRHLAPLEILSRRNVPTDALTVSVHMYANEVELTICHGTQPLFLRVLRVTPDAIQKTVDQLTLEVQRCSTLLPAHLASVTMTWYVFTTCESARTLAATLARQADANVQTLNPLLGWELDKDANGAGEAVEKNRSGYGKQTSAANSGAAWEFQSDHLRVNLLNPKKAPTAPNVALRWGGIGAAAVMVLGIAVYFLLSDIQKLRADILALEDELQGAEKVAAKFEEKADQVALVEGWLSDQVDWLSELDELSDRLPKGNQATVRRLTAATNGSNAVIDLSVQVSEQDNVSDLEHRIRSVKYSVSSKRISQKADTSEYPWRFETRVEFPIKTSQLDAADSEDYVPPQSPSDSVLGDGVDTKNDDPTTEDRDSAVPTEDGASSPSNVITGENEEQKDESTQPKVKQPPDQTMPPGDASARETMQ